MTCICGWIRTVTMAGTLLLSAAVASAQTTEHGQETPPGDHILRGQPAQLASGDQAMAKMHEMMPRMAAADVHLETLVADMNMFMGDLKVEAIARVLTLLVERQSMMHEHMMDMHKRMMRNMIGARSDRTTNSPLNQTTDAPPDTGIDSPPDAVTTDDIEPGTMCWGPDELVTIRRP